MIIAVVNDNVVTAIATIADGDAVAYAALAGSAQAAIDITAQNPQPLVGWVLSNNYIVPPAGYTVYPFITKLAFRERFTTAEMTAIFAAAATNFTLQAIIGNQQLATYVDLTRSDTIAGVNYLVYENLITSARATAILTTPPVASELYVKGA